METNPEIFDRTAALANVGGDRMFLDEIAGLFQAAWPAMLNDIRVGIAHGDVGAVETGARLVETAARDLSAKRVSESAHQLRVFAHQGALDASRVACLNLEREVKELSPYLTPLNSSKYH
jgi:hypothetical protein